MTTAVDLQAATAASPAVLPDPEAAPTITVPQAGRALRVCKRVAYDMAADGRIPTIRIGRNLRVPNRKFREQFGL